ncbi:uncharacterized protein METZ01_LOCUS368675 [marine metagenome]|uniref:Uncharacterized protein n=1 Tax=marine metagenome TaxID=408172 RepID=A0A382T3G9_9ZZZZ
MVDSVSKFAETGSVHPRYWQEPSSALATPL